MVTALLPVAEASAELTTLTVTVLGLGRAIGAVYMPEGLIVPVAALPPATPFTCQVTEVFDDPEAVALKDCVAPTRTLALDGEIVTVTLDPEEGELEFELEEEEGFVVPVQPPSDTKSSRSAKPAACCETRFLSCAIGKSARNVVAEADAPSLRTMPGGEPRHHCTEGQNQTRNFRTGQTR